MNAPGNIVLMYYLRGMQSGWSGKAEIKTAKIFFCHKIA
jgi:hypothetical protein